MSGRASGAVAARPRSRLSGDALFLVWGPPSHGPRSRVFAHELGIEARFVWSTKRRGLAVAPYKYGAQALKTLGLLFRRRPRVVFVQSPPSFAVMFVWLYCALTGARFVVDAHSAAMQSPYWTRPRRLMRHLARRAVTTIVTNEHFAGMLRDDGAHALVIRDVPTRFPIGAPYPVEGSFRVMAVNTFAPDEPLGEVLAAARELEDVMFYVTGDPSRARSGLIAEAPKNVMFTGFLPDETYYALMSACQAVLCLTTRDDTMQRGACEALSMGTPVITSNWPLLQSYFDKGAVHVDNTRGQIRAAVREIAASHDRFATAIDELRTERRAEWGRAVDTLIARLEQTGSFR